MRVKCRGLNSSWVFGNHDTLLAGGISLTNRSSQDKMKSWAGPEKSGEVRQKTQLAWSDRAFHFILAYSACTV